MGLLSRGSATARGQAEGERILRQAGVREEQAARHMARRAGVDVAGAEHVAYEAPRSTRCLVVRAERIDLYEPPPDDTAEADEADEAVDEPADAQADSLGVHHRMRRRDVREVLVEPGSSTLARVSVVGAEHTFAITVARTQAVLLRALLADGVPPLEDPSPPADGAHPTTPLDVLRQLAAMREEGLITAAEYDAKKADILGRM